MSPRLYLDHETLAGGRLADGRLTQGARVTLPRDQAHYLTGVMRLGEGDAVRVFDGLTGEWAATLAGAAKRAAVLEIGARTAPQRDPPDLLLAFAPIKKARTDFIVEKAAEMGVAAIQPVITARTNAGVVRTDRLQAHAVEAAEQCGGTFVPPVLPPVRLSAFLSGLGERALMWCDETRAGPVDALPDGPGPWAILIGPEGGFDEAERAAIGSLAAAAVSLGPRILRADTAAVAALTLWQSRLGDWR
ncbi:MAG: 16S rRNA (uracil(1498)-N(3))-methyltransferase [Paracoccaceae bacterium]